MTSGMACHRRPSTSPMVGGRGAWHEITALGLHRGRSWHDITAIGQNTIGRRRASHDITTLGQHTRSDYVRHGMTSLPLYSTHGRTTSGLACHHRLWAAQTIKRRRAMHAIIALGRQTRSDDVGRGMPSSPLNSTDGRPSSGVACYHRPSIENAVERRWELHAIIAFGQHTRSNDVGCGMRSPPLDRTQGRMTWGVTCHHHIWTTHTVELPRAWNDITAFGHHTRSNNVERDMPSLP